MFNFKDFCNILPIVFDDKILNFITFEDIDWYSDNCRKPYYEKYLDFKFSKDIKQDKFKEILYNLIVGYKLKIGELIDLRLLLKNSNGTIIGGCTVFNKRGTNDIELAYFILPEYQHNGYAKVMINNLMYAITKSDIKFDKFILQIREDNKASINLAKNLGFKKLHEVKGKYKTNIIYYKEVK